MKIKLLKLKCERCGYEWVPKKEEVRQCANPRCRSVWWDKKKNV